jgi:CRISPR-associated protein Cas2
MSQNTTARWLVTYDISDPKRLAKIFKALKKEGIPIQYSVFYLHMSAAKIGSLMVQLSKLIDTRSDDVRAYRLPERGMEISIGASILPEETWQDEDAPIARNSLLAPLQPVSPTASEIYANSAANPLSAKIK